MDLQEARRRTPPSGPGLIWGTTRHTSRMISPGQLLKIPQRSSDWETRVSECRKPAGQRTSEGSQAGASKCNFHGIFILEAGKNRAMGCYPTEARSANIVQNQP